MAKIKNIIEGHVNEVFGFNASTAETRMNICRECPLYKETNIGPICNPNLYIDGKTDMWRYSPAEGYTKGCGCRLNAKTRVDDEHCPAYKWG